MKKILLALLLSCVLLQAEETLQVSDFEVSVFSQNSKESVQLDVSLIFEGRDVETYDYKIIDALNVVVGSFYAENLLTSQGKMNLKKALVSFAKDKYSIDIDHIYIQKLNIVKTASTDDIIEALRKEGLFKK